MGSVYKNAVRAKPEVVAGRDSVTAPGRRCERPHGTRKPKRAPARWPPQNSHLGLLKCCFRTFLSASLVVIEAGIFVLSNIVSNHALLSPSDRYLKNTHSFIYIYALQLLATDAMHLCASCLVFGKEQYPGVFTTTQVLFLLGISFFHTESQLILAATLYTKFHGFIIITYWILTAQI